MYTTLTYKLLQQLTCQCSNANISFVVNENLNKLNLNSNEELYESIYVLDPTYYIDIVNALTYYLDHNQHLKKRTVRSVCYLTLCNHKHEYTPQNKYLGVRYDLFDSSNKVFFRAKISPYYINEYKRYEINMGIVLKNSRDIFVLGTYKKCVQHIKQIHHTNLSPSHIYIHTLDNKFFTEGFDTSHIGYKNDINQLNLYAQQINALYEDIDMKFDEFGIISYNTKYKICDVYNKTKKTIPYPSPCSYIINHHE